MRRIRRINQSNTAATAIPAHAASASTIKSSNRACRPGIQSCNSSSTPISTTAMAAREQATLRVGEAERQSDQHEGQRVFAVLAELGVRPKPRGTERGESHSSGQEPGDDPEDEGHALPDSTISFGNP